MVTKSKPACSARFAWSTSERGGGSSAMSEKPNDVMAPVYPAYSAAMSEKHPKVKRDKWADREADKDREEGDPDHPAPPTGSVGPRGSALDHLKDEAMESAPPKAP